MGQQSAVEIRRLTKVFGTPTTESTPVLDDVSLTIEDNEFFTLLGPSGCGKTTLLRLTAGFEQPTKGSVILFGRHMEGLAPDARPVNTVFQSYMLFPHMTVEENVGFGLRMLGRPAAEIKRRSRHVLSLVRLTGLENRSPHQLSGGQQQRVALARALAPAPRVLLLDEPLSALDLKLRHQMRGELKTLQRETGITFVFVTHDQDEALTMSDRIAVLGNGTIHQVGTPVDVYENPVNRFVAGFVGETNFIDAVIEQRSEAGAICQFGGNCRLAVESSGKATVGEAVILSVRPEKLRLEPIGQDDPEQLIGRIANRNYGGAGTTYQVDVKGGISLLVHEGNDVAGRPRLQEGEAVRIVVPPKAVRMLED